MSGLPPLRRRRALVAGGVVLGVATGLGAWLVLRPGGDATLADGLTIGGPFALLDGSGRTVTDRDLRGRYLLIYFGYTFCPDVCPTTLNTMAAALAKLGPLADHIAPIFITVDPERDTPAVVGRYVAAFSPRLIGLSGSPTQIATVEQAYRVYAARHITGPGPGDYTMDHSSLIYLMDRHGRFVTVLRADQTPQALAADIARHLTGAKT